MGSGSNHGHYVSLIKSIMLGSAEQSQNRMKKKTMKIPEQKEERNKNQNRMPKKRNQTEQKKETKMSKKMKQNSVQISFCQKKMNAGEIEHAFRSKNERRRQRACIQI